MATKIFYEADVDRERLKNKTVAIIGYGAQGRAHAQNLRDSGIDVVIGQRMGGQGFEDAVADQFNPVTISDAAENADILNILLPDEVHGEVFQQAIGPVLKPGQIIMTCHGFSFHYGLIEAQPENPRLLVAPKGQGHMVRGEFLNGGGVPCLIATDEGASADTLAIGLAYAAALGCHRAGIIETTIAAETETDLFGEQAVLCGGVTSLVQAGFDTLVEAGYQPELAYFECLHELKIIVDLLHSDGIAKMRHAISNTAEFGDYTQGPRIIDEHVRANMKQVLQEIQNGHFAKRFLAQHENHDHELQEFRQVSSESLIERVGQQLRSMMPWLKK
ncbi:MAG: ketol-acid reductoisomerase [Planctomycetota bacterium]